MQVPLAMVRGSHSRVVRQYHAREVRRLPLGEYHSLPGGHMFPLERPDDTAQLIRGLLERWQERQA
ncbi:Alpha/beta hydrolase family protein [compost metagenome]